MSDVDVYCGSCIVYFVYVKFFGCFRYFSRCFCSVCCLCLLFVIGCCCFLVGFLLLMCLFLWFLLFLCVFFCCCFVLCSVICEDGVCWIVCVGMIVLCFDVWCWIWYCVMCDDFVLFECVECVVCCFCVGVVEMLRDFV